MRRAALLATILFLTVGPARAAEVGLSAPLPATQVRPFTNDLNILHRPVEAFSRTTRYQGTLRIGKIGLNDDGLAIRGGKFLGSRLRLVGAARGADRDTCPFRCQGLDNRGSDTARSTGHIGPAALQRSTHARFPILIDAIVNYIRHRSQSPGRS